MLYKKMTRFITRSAISLGLLGLGFGTLKLLEVAAAKNVQDTIAGLKQRIAHMEHMNEQDKKRLEQTKQIELHIVKSMLIANAKLSDLQKATIVSTLANVAMTEFSTFEQRELWVAVLAAESRFNPKAKSPAGAVGIGQIMPKSAVWYGKKCGIENVTEQDLYEVQINAMLSACIFKTLLDKTGGSPTLSMIGYNAGAWSKDVERIDQMANVNTESANYVAKIHRFLEKTRSDGH